VLSRAGSAAVAMCAHASSKPVLVCCEAFKVRPRPGRGEWGCSPLASSPVVYWLWVCQCVHPRTQPPACCLCACCRLKTPHTASLAPHNTHHTVPRARAARQHHPQRAGRPCSAGPPAATRAHCCRRGGRAG
jgi:hypothetical protein